VQRLWRVTAAGGNPPPSPVEFRQLKFGYMIEAGRHDE